MKIALIQSDLIWENAAANRENFDSKINEINSEVNLIVLPEMFSTGFTMNAPEVAEEMNGETVRWMQSVSKQKNAAITGSIVIKENGQFITECCSCFRRENFNITTSDICFL